MPDDILLPRVLLTNDDGFAAPGLTLLAEIMKEFAEEVWIVAPESDQSGAAQALSMTRPIYATQVDERSWSVGGTPGDCVALALNHFMAESRPSLVLSGVNTGVNVGDEVNMSGTLGAVFTALIMGIPGIGISQGFATSREEMPWDTTRAILPKVLRHVLSVGWRKETCLSINIPPVPPSEIAGFSWARQSLRNIANVRVDARVSPRGRAYYWLKLERRLPAELHNSDHAILKRKEVAITALMPDRSVDLGRASVSFADTSDEVDSLPDMALPDV